MAEHDDAQVKERADAVWRAAAKYAEDISDESAYRSLAAAFRELGEWVRFEEADEDLDISDFFQSVGEGMVAAQEDLDDRTLESMRNPRPHASSAVYRIPKVTAEIQFGLRSTRSKKFGVLLFREGREEEAQRQHKVTFDIVAAPPPPDVLALADQLNLGPIVLTDPSEREAVLQRLRTASSSDNVAGKKAKRFSTRANFQRTLVFPVDRDWLCVLPLKEGPNIDMLRVLRAGGARAEGAGKDMPPALPHRLHDLAKVLVLLSERQAQGLRELSRRGRG